MISEFDIIREYFTRPTRRSDVALGIGDDAALVRVPAGQELALTTDTLVAGRHFPLDTHAGDIGWKSLAVSLSDLAAMGAVPAWFTLALTLPEPDTGWLRDFSAGLFELADQHGVELVGGDTTRGPLSITIQAHGLLPAGQALRRSGARAGDIVCVTGTLGDAALALVLGAAADAVLLQRLNRPMPRVSAGIVLRDLAHATIDISDGLAADLGHVLRASNMGAVIDVDSIPVSQSFNASAKAADRLRHLLAGGDDYELCVCLPSDAINPAQKQLECLLTPVGQVTAAGGLVLKDAGGRILDQSYPGYDHFAKR